MNTNEVKKIMVKDTMLYLPARIIEGVIGLLTITLYTGFFGTDVYGTYGLVTTTVNISSFLLLGWLIQSVFRYANSFDGNKKRVLFYSTSFTLWISINGIAVFAGIIGILIIGSHHENWLTQLYILGILQFVTYNTTQILLSILAATRRAKLHLVLSIFSVAAKLSLTVLLVMKYRTNSFTPAAAVISSMIIDTLIILVISIRLQLGKYITFRFFSRKVMKKFLIFSMPLVAVNLTMSILNLSDRYVITPILGTDQMGIYHANYQISSNIFTMILVAVMRGVYPMIIKTWRQNNKAQSQHLLSQAVRYYLLVSMPALVGISVLAPTISRLFLDEAFREQGFVIIFVAGGMFFYGLAEYSNKAWELTANTKPLFYNTLISAVVNLGVNIIFIPLYGYRVAAVSTLLSYLIYLALSMLRGRKVLKINFIPLSVIRILLSCVLMGVVVYLLINRFSQSALALLIFVLLGVLVYIGCLYVTKEIDSEVKNAVAWVKNLKK